MRQFQRIELKFQVKLVPLTGTNSINQSHLNNWFIIVIYFDDFWFNLINSWLNLIIWLGKVNSVTLDSCKKTSVVFDSVVSAVEFINCQSVQMQVLTKVNEMKWMNEWINPNLQIWITGNLVLIGADDQHWQDGRMSDLLEFRIAGCIHRYGQIVRDERARPQSRWRLRKITCIMSFSCHFTVIFLVNHFGFILMPFWCHFGVILMSVIPFGHFNRSNYIDVILMSFLCHFGFIITIYLSFFLLFIRSSTRSRNSSGPLTTVKDWPQSSPKALESTTTTTRRNWSLLIYSILLCLLLLLLISIFFRIGRPRRKRQQQQQQHRKNGCCCCCFCVAGCFILYSFK